MLFFFKLSAPCYAIGGGTGHTPHRQSHWMQRASHPAIFWRRLSRLYAHALACIHTLNLHMIIMAYTYAADTRTRIQSQHLRLVTALASILADARADATHIHHNLVHAATHCCSSSRRHEATLPYNVRIAMWPSHSNTRSPDSSTTLLPLLLPLLLDATPTCGVDIPLGRKASASPKADNLAMS